MSFLNGKYDLTTAERTALTNIKAGVQVYDTDLNKLMIYNGSAWQEYDNKSRTSVTIGQANADYIISASADLGKKLNEIINLEGSDTIVKILAGSYVSSTTIDLKGVSRFTLCGEGKRQTVITFAAGTSAINMANTSTDYYDNELIGFSIFHSNTQTGDDGTIGIEIARIQQYTVRDVYIRYYETGIKLSDKVFYGLFDNVKCQNCALYSVQITKGANDRCNQNIFVACVFLGDSSTGSNFTDTHVIINSGNANCFHACTFENWVSNAILFEDGVSSVYAEYNQVIGGRMESNQGTSCTAIEFKNSATGNYINWPYVSGSDISTDAIVQANSSVGNNWLINSFKGSVIHVERDELTAGSFASIIRNGSGNGSACLSVQDTYANSGSPTTLEVKCARPTGNFINCERASTSYFSVNTLGVCSAKGLNVDATTKSSIDQQFTSLGDVVLELKQQDQSEPFVDFVGTTAANANQSITSWTTGNSIQGGIKVNINGVTRWLMFYDAPTS